MPECRRRRRTPKDSSRCRRQSRSGWWRRTLKSLTEARSSTEHRGRTHQSALVTGRRTWCQWHREVSRSGGPSMQSYSQSTRHDHTPSLHIDITALTQSQLVTRQFSVHSQLETHFYRDPSTTDSLPPSRLTLGIHDCYRCSSLRCLCMACANEWSHSFTYHPHVYPRVEWAIPAFHHLWSYDLMALYKYVNYYYYYSIATEHHHTLADKVK